MKPPLKVSSTIEDSLIWDKVAMRFCWPFRQPWKLKDDSHHADRRDYELMHFFGAWPKNQPEYAISYFWVRRRQCALATRGLVSGTVFC
jgi:hypothetical protein